MKRTISVILSLALLLSLSACGRSSDGTETTEVAESQTAETTEATQSETSETDDTAQEADLTFADLSGYSFTFSSGAGAWATVLTIEKDGYFHGQYHDSDMGDTGEGYDHGTVYFSVFSGNFSDLTKTGDTVWTMTVADISYQDTVGETQIDTQDKIRYIYTEAYGLGTTMRVYWMGTPTADLSEDEQKWIGIWQENTGSDSTLTMPVLADAETGNAFYSYERQTPYEEAKTLMESCRNTYEELEAELEKAKSQADMNICAEKMYETSDDYLNQIWILVKYNLEEDEFSELLVEEQAWIAEKEATRESISAEWSGGSAAPLAVYTALAEMTLERCEVLTEALAD